MGKMILFSWLKCLEGGKLTGNIHQRNNTVAGRNSIFDQAFGFEGTGENWPELHTNSPGFQVK
jgi:hypothetical protein